MRCSSKKYIHTFLFPGAHETSKKSFLLRQMTTCNEFFKPAVDFIPKNSKVFLVIYHRKLHLAHVDPGRCLPGNIECTFY